MFPNTTVIGIYFSNDLSDSDLAPVYITRIVKSMTEKGYADPCMVIQLKNTLIEKMDAICIKVSCNKQCNVCMYVLATRMYVCLYHIVSYYIILYHFILVYHSVMYMYIYMVYFVIILHFF